MSQPIKVLHVDDEPDVADLAATFLQREHDRIRTTTATSPKQGLDILDDQDIDCIVSDYDMPGKNGVEFLKTVRAEDADLPFILFTGKGSEEIASEAISAGVTDYLQKGSDSSQYAVLANRINNAVSRSRAERQVQETQAYFSTILEHSSDYIMIVNRSGDIEYISPSVERVMGYEPEELEGMDAFEFVHEEDRTEAAEAFSTLFETPETEQSVVFRAQQADGSLCWLEVRGRNLLDDPVVGGILVDARDVTEHRKSRLQLETTIDNLPGYVYRHDADERNAFEFVKGDVEDVTGYTAAALEDDVDFANEVIHPDDREDVWTTIMEDVDAHGRFDTTYRIITQDGRTRWVRDQGQIIDEPVSGEEMLDGFVTDITAKRRQERQLARNTELLRHTETLSDLGGWEYNTRTEDLRWTDGTYRIHDLDPAGDFQPTLDTAIQCYHPADRGEIETSLDRCLQEGTPYETELRLRTDADRQRWVRTSGVPIRDDGEIVGARGAIQDVTNRKQRERDLERIRDFFAQAERLGDLGAWEFDAEGNLTWTEGTRRIHGVDTDFEPSLGDGIEFFHPEDKDTIEEAVSGALEHGDPYDVEARILRPDGEERWVRTRGSQRGDDDEIRGFIQDITEQKERERALRNAKSQLEAAVAAGSVGTWEWHIPSDEVVVDPAFARTFGVDPAHARAGVPLERFVSAIHEEDRERVVREIESAVDRSGSYDAEYRVWDEGDSMQWVLARGVVEHDEDGQAVRFPGVFVNITERKRRERELERQNARLEQFSRIVSHDLQNPLNVARGRLELAQEEVDSEHFDAVAAAHRRMSRLIDDLLELARHGTTVDDPDPVSLVDVLERAWSQVETENATLESKTERTIRAERSRLQQLFENLIRNAVDHGGPAVTVHVGTVEEGIFVEDDGSGIPEDARNAVFEPGYSSTSDGTGFGLSIVEEIVDAHGWSIRVTDGAMGGARFEIVGVEFPTS